MGIESVILHDGYDTKGRRAYKDIAIITLKPNTGKLKFQLLYAQNSNICLMHTYISKIPFRWIFFLLKHP